MFPNHPRGTIWQPISPSALGDGAASLSPQKRGKLSAGAHSLGALRVSASADFLSLIPLGGRAGSPGRSPIFTEKETEAQRADTICLTSHSKEEDQPRFETRAPLILGPELLKTTGHVSLTLESPEFHTPPNSCLLWWDPYERKAHALPLGRNPQLREPALSRADVSPGQDFLLTSCLGVQETLPEGHRSPGRGEWKQEEVEAGRGRGGGEVTPGEKAVPSENAGKTAFPVPWASALGLSSFPGAC